MPTLHDTYKAISASLLQRGTEAESLILGETFPASDYIEIYRNNVFASLTEALANIYPVVFRLVGEDFFGAACKDFIPDNPPKAAPLHRFGNQFSEFLSHYAPAASLVYLPDVALLEWAWHEAYHAADAERLDTAALAKITEDDQSQLRFGLHPSVRLIRSPYPIQHIWQVNQADFEGDENVNLDTGDVWLMVVRRDLQVEIETLKSGEWNFLTVLKSGAQLSTALDLVHDDAEFDLAAVLQQRTQDGTLVSAAII